MVGAVFVGLWAGLTAVLLKISVHHLQALLKPLGLQYSWIYFLSPAVGILLTYLFIQFVLNGELKKGTSHVLMAIAKKSSFLPRKEIFSHAVTSALTVGLGGSAGLESPIIQTGSAIGTTFSSFFPIGYRDRTVLLACGAAAGIATAFNAPIAGVLFALEALLVDVSISAFIPLLIAGATGALCSKIILEEGILLSFKHVSAFNYKNVPFYILLGIACGLVSYFYINAFLKTEILFLKIFRSGIAKLFGGVILLGGLIVLFPALFGEGYSSITALAYSKPSQLLNGSPLKEFFLHSEWSLGLAILITALIKVFAVSFTLNAGGNGGNFAPSLLVGACLGFSFAFLFNLTGISHLPTSNFCLVAMAGVLTGIFHAPLTGIFLIAEITGGYELIIPLMIVSALSTAVSRYLNPHSLDEAKLKQSDKSISFGKDSHILSELSLSNFIEKDFATVQLHASMRTLVDAVAHSKRNIFPVLDENGNLAGVIILENIREVMFNTSLYDTITIDQFIQKPQVVANLNEDMSQIMEKFDKSGVWNIPVLNKGKYIGFISKSNVFSNYRDRLKNM
ncbi:MAG TPA: chloride channel protein [Cyclobacteriaceae bacterium]|nr:chloride channel protein [Cyclobacteriaceae bacterium]